ncbi:hypothetical protein BH18VER1_BH18VER1_09050 [soil metagenome]
MREFRRFIFRVFLGDLDEAAVKIAQQLREFLYWNSTGRDFISNKLDLQGGPPFGKSVSDRRSSSEPQFPASRVGSKKFSSGVGVRESYPTWSYLRA